MYNILIAMSGTGKSYIREKLSDKYETWDIPAFDFTDNLEENQRGLFKASVDRVLEATDKPIIVEGSPYAGIIITSYMSRLGVFGNEVESDQWNYVKENLEALKNNCNVILLYRDAHVVIQNREYRGREWEYFPEATEDWINQLDQNYMIEVSRLLEILQINHTKIFLPRDDISEDVLNEIEVNLR